MAIAISSPTSFYNQQRRPESCFFFYRSRQHLTIAEHVPINAVNTFAAVDAGITGAFVDGRQTSPIVISARTFAPISVLQVQTRPPVGARIASTLVYIYFTAQACKETANDEDAFFPS